jgi:Protein of unknown function (DUF4232)
VACESLRPGALPQIVVGRGPSVVPDCVIVSRFVGVTVVNDGLVARFDALLGGFQGRIAGSGRAVRFIPARSVRLARGLHCLRLSIDHNACTDVWVRPRHVRPTPPACPADQLKARFAGTAVAMTGEQSAFITITNTGTRRCELSGFPTAQLLHLTRVLPFRHRHGGQYIHGLNHDILDVSLVRGASANFLIAKYRCDAKQLSLATAVLFRIDGITGRLTATLPDHGDARPGLYYCQAFNGHPNRTDPGNQIEVSRIAAGRGNGI